MNDDDVDIDGTDHEREMKISLLTRSLRCGDKFFISESIRFVGSGLLRISAF